MGSTVTSEASRWYYFIFCLELITPQNGQNLKSSIGSMMLTSILDWMVGSHTVFDEQDVLMASKVV